MQRLEDKCIDMIGYNFYLLKLSSELLTILIEEVNSIKQSGDINIPDIPLAAEIRRAIYNHSGSYNIAKAENHIECLRTLVSVAAGK